MGSFSRSLRQYYEAKVLSEAGIFCLIVWYLIIAVPFYLSFSTQKLVPVSYLFTGKYIANLKYYNANGQTTFFTSNVPELQGSTQSATTPVVSLTGLTTSSTTHSISATLKLNSATDTLSQVELMLFYQLTIPILNAKYIVASVVNVPWRTGQSAATLTGIFDYTNKQTLSAIQTGQLDFNFAPYFRDFSYQSNYTVIKNNAYSSNFMLQTNIFHTDAIMSTATPFQINILFASKPTAILTYYSGFLQTLKMAYSQYVSLWLISFALGLGLLVAVAKSGVFALVKKPTELEFINNSNN